MRSVTGLSRQPGCVKIVVKGLALGVVLLLFRYEVTLIWNLLRSAPDLAAGRPSIYLPAVDVLLPNLLYLGMFLLSVVGLVLLVVFLVAGSVLPVRTPLEHIEVMRSLMGFLFGGRAHLVRVREGAIYGREGEDAEDAARAVSGGSIVLVDLNSAVVLEKRMARSAGAAAALAPGKRSRGSA
ncbi:MAG: hypothetical protein ACKOC5_16285, partial [Chloroflexota bacterium]